MLRHIIPLAVLFTSSYANSSENYSPIDAISVDGSTISWDDYRGIQVTDSLSGEVVCDAGAVNCQTGLGRFNTTDIRTGQTREVLVCEGSSDWRHYVDQKNIIDQYDENNPERNSAYTREVEILVQNNTHNIEACWPDRSEVQHRSCHIYRLHSDITVPRNLVHSKPNDFSFLESYLQWHTEGFDEVIIPDSLLLEGESTTELVNVNLLYRDCDYKFAGLQGPQGEAGPQGLRGETGATGRQGVRGDTGPQGPKR